MTTYPSEQRVEEATFLADCSNGLASTDLIPERAIRSSYSRRGKRALDVALSSAGLVACAPVLGAVWVALRFRLGPNVVLRQQRVGLHGKTFSMYKFRTMQNCRRVTLLSSFVGPDRRRIHKSNEDPRHTRLGRLVRKFSLDELPQLLNIVRGDMSLVGPRPELAAIATPEFRAHVRHDVRPGLTGPFQTSDLRAFGSLDVGLDLDEQYVREISLAGDLNYLRRTTSALRDGTGS